MTIAYLLALFDSCQLPLSLTGLESRLEAEGISHGEISNSFNNLFVRKSI